MRRVLPSLLSIGFITWPLCGALFRCGCTWVWSGAHRHCNYFATEALSRCPWCVRPWSSGVMLLLAACPALWIADRIVSPGIKRRYPGLLHIVSACAVYLAFAVLFAKTLQSPWF